MTRTCTWERNQLFSFTHKAPHVSTVVGLSGNICTNWSGAVCFRREADTGSLNAIIIIGLPAPALRLSLQACLALPSSAVCPMGSFVVIAGKDRGDRDTQQAQLLSKGPFQLPIECTPWRDVEKGLRVSHARSQTLPAAHLKAVSFTPLADEVTDSERDRDRLKVIKGN